MVISGGEDCSVRVNDIRVGKAVKSFYHTNYVNSVAIGNNNKDITITKKSMLTFLIKIVIV